ncbi:MAG: pyruvate, phosphate dikinase [Planctomycetes bacterium]|nr:pyruvate, phosphate dikinase [Planctomycetota bacterium]
MNTSSPLVYSFAAGNTDVADGGTELLGGKGKNLAEMTRLGIPVPPGFTIATTVCANYSENLQKYGATRAEAVLDELWPRIETALTRIEDATGRKFADPGRPLLVSVRSGAARSMPGMMDTILNLGLDEESVRGLADESGDARFAHDAFRRFVQMYANVVLGVDSARFERLLKSKMQERGVHRDADLSAEDLILLRTQFESIVLEETGKPFPMDAREQLRGAILAVLASWNNERARIYRRIHRIDGLLGTAVNVQAMVFGNLGEDSGTGVAFTRDPSTGDKTPYGEFLINAQGEDVVAGVRTPRPLAELDSVMPSVAAELRDVMDRLERHYRDVQDIEFTIERGKLYLLQTRNGKRTATASLRIAVALVDEGIVTEREAVRRVEASQLEQLMHPQFDPNAEKETIGDGIAASPGSAAGRIALSPDRAKQYAAAGDTVVLVRMETSPEDLEGMACSLGFLTAHGGKTSHAAVVARQMGKVCVSGCGSLVIDEDAGTLRIGDHEFAEGDSISLDGTNGQIYAGLVPTVEARFPPDFERFMGWVDEARRLRVRVNADTPKDCRKAREFGAEGIGLCRTEHMFFGASRILAMRRMIVAQTGEERRTALESLEPLQRGDFEEIFRVMDGLPCNIRLLDPPLHEFLPHDDEGQRELATTLGISVEHLRARLGALHEANPMLGHRGCRLGISYPEIYEMQARAILDAACRIQNEGRHVFPEIMIPLVAEARELEQIRERLVVVAEAVFAKNDTRVDYHIGTMIEIPRAAITAERVAEHADFFSFGTNDLTQMTWGFSRDDAGSFFHRYFEDGILELDPFEVIDEAGVGFLMRHATEQGRKTKPKLKVGICGETGGEARSIAFCHALGLDYVSCSPYRILGARLAAAQAAVAD